MQFEAQATITVQPTGDKFVFKIFKQDQLDKLIEILRLLEASANEEQARMLEQSQADDEVRE